MKHILITVRKQEFCEGFEFMLLSLNEFYINKDLMILEEKTSRYRDVSVVQTIAICLEKSKRIDLREIPW